MAIYNAPVAGPLVVGQPKSGYTPAVGDLVIWDSTVDWGVDKCADNENPVGIVRLVPDVAAPVFEYFGKAIVKLTYNASDAPSRGDKVQASGANTVEQENSTGVGTVISKDVPTTGDCVVAF